VCKELFVTRITYIGLDIFLAFEFEDLETNNNKQGQIEEHYLGWNIVLTGNLVQKFKNLYEKQNGRFAECKTATKSLFFFQFLIF